MFKRTIYLALSFCLSFVFAFSAFPQSTPKKNPLPNIRLKSTKVFGNRCVSMGVNEVKSWNDVGASIILRIDNKCDKDQLVNTMVAFPRELFSFKIWSPGTMSREVWPENKPYPVRFGFVPIHQLQSGFVIPSGKFVTTEMISTNTEGLNPISFRLGACDLFVAGNIQAVFHDANLQTNFECYPIPNSRTLEVVNADNPPNQEPEAEPIIDTNSRNCKPEYPMIAIRNEETGRPFFKVTINQSGDIILATLEKTSGFRSLDNALRNALLNPQCKVAWTKGIRSKTTYEKVVSFLFDF